MTTALALAVGLGCGSDGPRPPASSKLVAVAVRDCSSSGEHGLAGSTYRNSLRVGPLTLTNLKDAKAIEGLDPPIGGRYPALEAIAVLRAGNEVTVTVPARERSTVALLYDKSKFRDDGLYYVPELDSGVVFKACKDASFNRGVSQFDGGLVVTRRQCIELDFRLGSHARAVRRYVAYGRPCPPTKR